MRLYSASRPTYDAVMASPFDETEFVDTSAAGVPAPRAGGRPPSRAELDGKVTDAQQKLVELKQAQEELERERSALEEARRRQSEFHTGREEMLHHLTRGVGLLGEAELGLRRDSEQMAKTVAALQEALTKIQGIDEESWTKDSWSVELTRALTVVENARLEWNSARLKWPSLDEVPAAADAPIDAPGNRPIQPLLAVQDFRQLCKIGLALTWPLVLLLLAILLILLTRK
jgi:hypothetical protein